MKQTILALSLAIISTPLAAHPAGCGLGTHVIFTPPQNWAEHVLAASTNVAASNTFAMTSGTIGCEAANGPLANRVSNFVNDNLDELTANTAKGEGEHLEALATLIAITPEDKALFKRTLKKNFVYLAPNTETTASDFVYSLATIMSTEARLTKYLL